MPRKENGCHFDIFDNIYLEFKTISLEFEKSVFFLCNICIPNFVLYIVFKIKFSLKCYKKLVEEIYISNKFIYKHINFEDSVFNILNVITVICYLCYNIFI